MPKIYLVVITWFYLRNFKGLKTAHINTGDGGLLYHLNDVERVLDKHNLDILCLSETWIDQNCDPDELNLSGYLFEHVDNDGSFIGKQGVGFYIKEGIAFKPKYDLSTHQDLMSMTLEFLPSKCTSFLLTVVYRHPKSPVSFMDNFEHLIMDIDNTHKNSILTGDFNCDFAKISVPGSSSKRLQHLCAGYNFSQQIKTPTRITEHSSTIIDLTFTNIPSKLKCGVEVVSVADHLMNYTCIPFKCPSHQHRYVTARCYKNLDTNNLIVDVQNIPWHIIEAFEDIDDCWNIWKSLFLNVVNQHAPLRKFRAKKSICKWYSKDIEDIKNLRDEYHTRAIDSEDPHAWAVYRKLRNRCTNMTRDAKKKYYETSINNCSGNSKDMWTVLKNLLPSKSNSGIVSLSAGEKMLTVASDIANEFNSYFVNIGSNLAAKLHTGTTDISYHQYLHKLCGSRSSNFTFHIISADQVLKVLQNLSVTKATGLDNIQAKVLKICAPSIAQSISYIFNLSLRTGSFPCEWKTARISALFKKGSKLEVGNYRPISILPVISKCLEKLVHDQVYEYLSRNELLARQQSGFRPRHSTQTSLHLILEDLYSGIHQGNLVGMVALDLRKAFDTVDHAILLDKLKHYGFLSSSLSWFTSYLTDRRQISQINGSLSDSADIRTGVPQGSILGPLLFVIYMNDLPTSLEHCHVNMYADDTAFYISAPSVNEITLYLQTDLVNVSHWLNVNKLSLHIGKTSTMLICSRQKRCHLPVKDINIKLQDQDIVQTDTCNYLGVNLDCNLTFDNHMNRVCGKICQSLGVLKRASMFVPYDTKLILYNTLVLPHFDYCSTVWDVCSDYHISRLQKLQNRGMRILLGCDRKTHICDMLVKLKWLNVRQRFFLNKCVLMYKIIHHLTPSYMDSVINSKNHCHL